MVSIVAKIMNFLNNDKNKCIDKNDNHIYSSCERVIDYPKQMRYIICQISTDLVAENNLIKIADPEVQYKEIIKIIHLMTKDRREKLLIFVFPELSFPKLLFKRFIDDLQEFENNFIIFIGLDYLRINEAKKLLEDSNFKKNVKKRLISYLNRPENQEKILNIAALIHKFKDKCDYYIYQKMSPSKYEISFFGNNFLCGFNSNIISLPIMNLITFICYDFIDQTQNKSTLEKLRKWIDKQYPNFILTDIFTLELTPVQDDVFKQFEMSVLEYYFTSLRARFLNPLSIFTTSIFVNSAFNTSFNDLFHSNMDSCFGKSSIYFVGTKLDVVYPSRDGFEIIPIAPLPELLAVKIEEDEMDNKTVGDDEIAKKRGKRYFKEGKGLIQIKVDSNNEHILTIELLSPHYGGRKRIESIDIFERRNGEWKII